MQCEKFSKKEEALALLLGKDGEVPKKFTDVARDYSEDKAKTGKPTYPDDPPGYYDHGVTNAMQ